MTFNITPECNAYTCPAGALLKPSGTLEKKGKKMNKYSSKAKNCAACSLCNQCLPQKTPYRQIYRWEYEEIADQHKDRMKKKGAEQMKKRAALAEHPFGTLKLWLGWTHFLLRGFEKVRAELELLVLSYNFKRVLSILGVEAFCSYLKLRGQLAKSEGNEGDLSFFWATKLVLGVVFDLFSLVRGSPVNFSLMAL